MVLPLISEEDYLSHYGRKGMKWYQHIFGDKDERQRRRSAEKMRNQSFKVSETLSGDKLRKKSSDKSHKRSMEKAIKQYSNLEKTYKEYLKIQKNPILRSQYKSIVDKAMKDIVDYEYVYRFGKDSVEYTRWEGSKPKNKKARDEIQREIKKKIKK